MCTCARNVIIPSPPHPTPPHPTMISVARQTHRRSIKHVYMCTELHHPIPTPPHPTPFWSPANGNVHGYIYIYLYSVYKHPKHTPPPQKKKKNIYIYRKMSPSPSILPPFSKIRWALHLTGADLRLPNHSSSTGKTPLEHSRASKNK